MKKTELVFVPSPVRGHVVSMVELANELLRRDQCFSATILVVKSPFPSNSGDGTSASLRSLDAHNNIQFVDVPPPEQLPSKQLLSQSLEILLGDYMESHTSNIKDIVAKRFENKLGGLILDLFCSAMIRVAEELHVPSYLYFTSGAAFFGFMLFFHSRHLRGSAVFHESDPESDVPSYANPVPPTLLPAFALSKNRGYDEFVNHSREYKRVKGVIINTVLELEPHAMGSLANDGVSLNPAVYAVGPLLDLEGKAHQRVDPTRDEVIMRWLDDQPDKSVVFLCFGSLGALRAPQLRQIAVGLEKSGHRFLWSVSKATSEDTEEFLPEGFSERTRGLGMLCGWAPQVAVLQHRAVGGFVSHCGWNSILESLWFGVPMATWPLYAEQQLNAFEMVRELGLAVELRLDYRMDGCDVVAADEVARAVRCLIDGGGEVRERVEAMSDTCRRAIAEGGSSFESLGRLIDDIMANAT